MGKEVKEMKKEYEELEIELILFEEEDVIATSGGDEENPETPTASF